MEMTNIITPEEQEAILQRTWEKFKDAITKEAEYATRTHLSCQMRQYVEKQVSKEIDSILSPILEERRKYLREYIEARLADFFDVMKKSVDSVLNQELQDTNRLLSSSAYKCYEEFARGHFHQMLTKVYEITKKEMESHT